MKPLVKNTLLIILALAGLLVIGLLWLLWTPSGARTVLGAVSRFSALEIEAGEVSGRLADELRLDGALVTWPDGEAEIGRLHLRWSPAALARRHLDVEALLIEEVHVRLHPRPERAPVAEPTPPDLIVPMPGEGALRWGVEVDTLRVEEFTLHRAGEESVHLQRVEVRLAWAQGVFSAENLEVHSPQGRLSGGGRVDLVAPEIRIDLQAEPTEGTFGEVEVVSVRLHLEPAPGERQMAGPFEAYLRSDERELLRLESEAEWTRTRIGLSDLRLERPEHDGRVAGSVALLAEDEWRFRGDLQLSGFDLHPETGVRTDLSGRLAVAGTPQAFEGNLSLSNAVPGWQQGSLRALFRGGAEAIEIPSLQGEWLQGRVQGRLAADWRRGWRVDGEFSGAELDPAVITADWPGQINFAARVSASGGEETPPSVEVQGELRESFLRGRALTGEIEARLDDGDLEIDTLVLRGEGFDIDARGRLRERIDFRADIPRLSSLVPDGSGSLRADGWARWRDERLTGRLEAEALGIAVGQFRADQLALSAEHRTSTAPFSVIADIRSLSYGDLLFDTAMLRAEGTLDGHTLRLSLNGPDVRLQGNARGAYRQDVWAGVIGAFEVDGERFGSWALADRVDLRISAERFVLTPFRLVGEEGAFVLAEADLAFSPRLGVVQGSWERLDLALLDPWIADTTLTGRSTGSLRATWFERERLDLQGRISASGTIVRDGERLEAPLVQAQLAWGVPGLQAQWEIEVTDAGRASGLISSPHSARLGLPPSGQADAKWIIDDLGAFAAWIPDLELTGESSGDVVARWQNGHPPRIDARARMAGSLAHGELRLGIEEAAAELDWDEKGLRGEWKVDLGENGRTSGRIESTDVAGAKLPQHADLQAAWEGVNLALLAPLVPEAEFVGESSGRVQAHWEGGGERLRLQGNLSAAARLARDEMVLEVQRAEADLLWDEEGLQGRWELLLDPEGRLSGEIRSDAPGSLQFPEQGRYSARWEGIDLVRLRPWLPPEMLLEGALAGELQGQWLPGQRLQMTGRAEVRDGEMLWEGEAGIVEAPLRRAEFSWGWEGEALQGALEFVLADYGHAVGEFRLPLPARYPVELDPAGPVSASLKAQMREEGLINAFLPGVIQESRGLITLDLNVGGTWAQPDLGGEARLADAGAYLPAAGVRLEDVQLQLRLEGEEIHLISFQARSGDGEIAAEGSLLMRDWRPQEYQFQLRGNNFQAVRLPELQMLASPDLTIAGTPQRVSVRGEIRLPYMLITGRQTPAPVQPSPDVIVVDAPEREERHSPLEIDVRVNIVLGDRVLIDAEGIDARLEGSLRVTMRGLEPEEITAVGEIRVAQGRYAAYGLNLTITRGVVLFAGGPIDRPILDILAVRTIGEVQAGVLISGTPRDPEIALYSDPTMTDIDVLSYIVLGHPLGQDTDDPDLLLFAAGALLTRGESVVLQDRIRGRLGLDVLTLEAGDGDVTGSRITIGKYLNPDLYVSIGQSLFTNVQVVRVRYRLGRRLELESTVGQESAVDLYYRIEFR